ncbi:MAG: SIR2 family protein [Bacteroidota bacterium]
MSTAPLDQSREMKDGDWNEILASIEREECILVLGPGAVMAKDGTHLHDNLAGLIAKELGHPVPDTPDRVFRLTEELTQQRGWRKLLWDMTKKAFADPEPHALFQQLTHIPLHLIISTSPDVLLKEAFEKEGIDAEFAYYNYKENPEFSAAATRNMPLIFNLFGSIEDEDSMVMTHDSLFDFIFAILSTKRLPLQIKENILNAYNFIFLGFDFESWYLKILMRLFESHKKEISYAHAWQTNYLQPHTQNFYTQNFKIDFISHDVEAFVKELHKRCEAEGIFRQADPEAAQASDYDRVVAMVKQGKIDEAIDFLDKFAEESGNNNLFTEVVLLSRRYNSLIGDQNKGIIAKDDAQLELNQISNALLEMAGEIKS